MNARTPQRRDSDQGHRFFRFDPTISMGTIVLMSEILVAAGLAYGTYAADKARTELRITQMQTDISSNRTNAKEILTSLDHKMEMIQVTLGNVSLDVAVLKAGLKDKP